MPRFKVVEFYPQAEVRRTLIVDAPHAQRAKEDPHSGLVEDRGYEVDEGGEAVTEECERVKDWKPTPKLFWVRQDVTRMRGLYMTCAVVVALDEKDAVRVIRKSLEGTYQGPDPLDDTKVQVVKERLKFDVLAEAAGREIGVYCLSTGEDYDV